MRPGVGGEELEVPRIAFLEINGQRVVVRVAVGYLCIDRTERRNHARCSQRTAGGQCAIEDRRRDDAVSYTLDEEVVRRAWAEKVGCRRSNDSPTSGDRDQPGNWLRQNVGAGCG